MPSGNDKTKNKEPRKVFFRHILRKIFLEDWALKLVALVITLGLWFGVTGLSTPATKRFTVQLAPNVANNVEITNNAIAEVEIVVSGDERKLKTLTSSGLVAALDLTSTPNCRSKQISTANRQMVLRSMANLSYRKGSRCVGLRAL